MKRDGMVLTPLGACAEGVQFLRYYCRGVAPFVGFFNAGAAESSERVRVAARVWGSDDRRVRAYCITGYLDASQDDCRLVSNARIDASCKALVIEYDQPVPSAIIANCVA